MVYLIKTNTKSKSVCGFLKDIFQRAVSSLEEALVQLLAYGVKLPAREREPMSLLVFNTLLGIKKTDNSAFSQKSSIILPILGPYFF